MTDPRVINHWDFRFLRLAAHVSTWSKDPSTQVGACIIRPSDRAVISLSYNGFARGVADTPERLADRETKYMLTVHAEENAILTAPETVRGLWLYTTHHPCERCASRIVQAGIGRVICMTTADYLSRWAQSVENARVILAEGGVPIDVVEFEQEDAA